ncbi:Polyketide synthase PksJ [Symbiodinium microadriaticum]|uniref:Polyketide synthase PksJ n=1 Tax=Symbiodinium microadriaticum TaxID=2951 RepID=A0A1Q9EID3_SYMMI|nr:Polyketide synthase PksJ [Symbiodinium microadriaticum]
MEGEDEEDGLTQLLRLVLDRRDERPAVLHCAEFLSFAELEERVAELSMRLGDLEDRISGFVGICVHRSFALVVSLLACLFSKKAFICLDPAFPAKRLGFILDDSGPGALLLDEAAVQQHSHLLSFCRHFLLLDRQGQVRQTGTQPQRPRGEDIPDGVAYAIYTSGSTGQPKGVVVSRSNLYPRLKRGRHNLLSFFLELLGFRLESFVWVAVTTFCFDIALLELILPLMCNCMLDVVETEISKQGPELKARLAKYPRLAFQATPSSYNLLRSCGWAPPAGSVLLCGGEPFPPWLSEFGTDVYLHNVYGPTETTIWSTAQHVDALAAGASVPIGPPIRETTLRLSSEGGERADRAEKFESGEIIIGGAGVSLGYWKRDHLTLERFTPAPSGGKEFRTGDLGRRDASGKTFCLGRIDEQVKVNGFRLELCEVDAALRGCPEVEFGACDVRRNRLDQVVLVAYVVWREGEGQDGRGKLHSHLREHLPEYMWPQKTVVLDKLPVTLNGKLERKRLPDPWQLQSELLQDKGKDQPLKLPEVCAASMPTADALRILVFQVIEELIEGTCPGVMHQKTGECDRREEWRHLGLTSSMAAAFAVALGRSLSLQWPQRRWPALGAATMFECATVSRLVAKLLQEEKAAEAAPASLDRRGAARHVVSLGSLCMTAQAMEHLGFRRWPGPFDWVFSAPEMVTHCLKDGFAAFLDQSRYVATACKKAGHTVYSPMLNRDVIFNHHNPMIPADYEFLQSCVRSLQHLLKGWTATPVNISLDDFVLFLLFNLERRVELQDAAVLELFEELVRQSQLPFRLLVVKVVTKAADAPQESLLMQRSVEEAGQKSKVQELYVHQLKCQGSHDGWRFSDDADFHALERIICRLCSELKLFAGAPTMPLLPCSSEGCPYLCTWLAGHCCHRCSSKAGWHGPRCDRHRGEGQDQQGPVEPARGYKPSGHFLGTVSRAERFRSSLSQAQTQGPQGPSLSLQTSALRRLERCLRADIEAETDETRVCESGESFEPLGQPIHEGPSWKLWCPLEANLSTSLQLLRAALLQAAQRRDSLQDDASPRRLQIPWELCFLAR